MASTHRSPPSPARTPVVGLIDAEPDQQKHCRNGWQHRRRRPANSSSETSMAVSSATVLVPTARAFRDGLSVMDTPWTGRAIRTTRSQKSNPRPGRKRSASGKERFSRHGSGGRRSAGRLIPRRSFPRCRQLHRLPQPPNSRARATSKVTSPGMGCTSTTYPVRNIMRRRGYRRAKANAGSARSRKLGRQAGAGRSSRAIRECHAPGLSPSPTCGWRSCQAVGYALEAEDLPCRQRATTA